MSIMMDKAFQFDLASWKWVECDSRYIMPDISELPLHVVYQFWDNEISKYRYCVWHDASQRMLEVAEIKSPDCLLDSLGNEYQGLFAVAFNHADFSAMDSVGAFGVEEAPFRWRVFQRKIGTPLLLAVDCATVPRKEKNHGHRSKNRTIVYQHSFLTSQSKYLANDSERYVPEIVYRTALEALQDDIATTLGTSPILTPWIKNTHLASSLQAFIEQPYAPNVIALKPFIGHRFDELFSHFTRDDFEILSQQFSIEPSDELREAYAYNPYTIVIYLLMRQMGISHDGLISKLFDFADSFLGVKLGRFRFDWEKKCIEIESEAGYNSPEYWVKSCMLDDAKFFISWLAEQKKTVDIKKYLFQCFIWCAQPNRLHDFFEMFHEYFSHIGQRNKDRLLNEGLTIKAIEDCEQSIAQVRMKANIARNGRTMAHLDLQVNGHNFRVIDNELWLPYICQQLHCEILTDYREKCFADNMALVSVDKGGKFVACIELHLGRYNTSTGSLKGIHGDYKLRPSRGILEAAIYWAKLHRLTIESDTLQHTECIWYDDTKFHRRNCPPRKIYSANTLDILQKMAEPDTENANAYYHALALRLQESSIPHLAMPAFLVPKTEMEYLDYVFPQGRRLFRGAMEGIAQAQYELAALYQNDRFFPPDQQRMLYWCKQAAQNGQAEAIWQMAVLSLWDKDLIQAKNWLAQLSQHAGMFGYMAKAVLYLLEENALSIKNVIGCMRGFQARG